ncbi:UNVERIFIED_CONTAM: hypothetical protein Sangu_1525800 [Sesamum angustifolium]|uniref:PGG domain-containing protein n=1 Tax=Sesamum angustifolium TaxID=2727405 RepID=A0AAW2MT77_9LAMI
MASPSMQQPPWASATNAVHFVPTKLSFKEEGSNYPVWKQQMLCIIQSQGLLGFIDGTNPPPPPETAADATTAVPDYDIWSRTDVLLKGWILCSLEDDIAYEVLELQTSGEVWLELENKFQRLSGEGSTEEETEQQEAEGQDLKEHHLLLYRAALQGNWEAAKQIFDHHPEAMTARIDRAELTALHIAVGAGRRAIRFVEKLVALMAEDSIAAKDENGSTALAFAATVGNVEAAAILVNRMPSLLYIPNFVGLRLLLCVIDAEFLDTALDLVAKYPDLAILKDSYYFSALEKITTKKSVFCSERRFNFWERFILSFENRSEHVYNLIYQMSDHKHFYSDLCDVNGNNLLHLAAKLAPSHKLNEISGAALQMQREIQWYKEVEKFVHPHSRERLNNYAKSPKMVFTEEHKILKEEGEKWMKDTSNSCTIAAALIATVMFAAAITVPGGNDNSNGFPIFSGSSAFIIFAISDAVSLFTSATSLLMFLAIQTSRYAEQDFLYVLPKRLIIGLGTLFLSICSMMVAFSATVYLVFARKEAWVLIPVGALACLPVTSFVLLQFPSSSTWFIQLMALEFLANKVIAHSIEINPCKSVENSCPHQI